MNRFTVIGVMLMSCLMLVGNAWGTQSDDISQFNSCKFCGMDRGKFAHSRILIDYEDGSAVGTCSIHCAAVDLAINIDKTPKTIWVGDFNSKQLIDAEKAFWVIDANKMGVMTHRAKWAFGKQEEAQQYITANGGQAADFDAVMKATYEDMYADTKMIREKRKMKRMKMQKSN
jgi:copper chaperone NosL